MAHGYQPSYGRRIMRVLAKAVTRTLGLGGKSTWSNEVLQSLSPTAETTFNDQTLKFRTGNGRLLWRVQTFATEEPLMIEWISQMESGDVVLDIGANCGLYSVAMARMGCRVFACELDLQNVGLIKENAYLNDVHQQIVVLPIACGGNDAAIDVYFRDLIPGDALQSMNEPQTIPTRLGKHSHQAPVLTLSLDALWERSGFERPSKVKIDVDGNERTVFAGCKGLCATADEIYYEDSGTPDCREVLSELLALGFEEVSSRSIRSGTAPGSLTSSGYNRLLRRNHSISE